jgi:hypothetical protein
MKPLFQLVCPMALVIMIFPVGCKTIRPESSALQTVVTIDAATGETDIIWACAGNQRFNSGGFPGLIQDEYCEWNNKASGDRVFVTESDTTTWDEVVTKNYECRFTNAFDPGGEIWVPARTKEAEFTDTQFNSYAALEALVNDCSTNTENKCDEGVFPCVPERASDPLICDAIQVSIKKGCKVTLKDFRWAQSPSSSNSENILRQKILRGPNIVLPIDSGLDKKYRDLVSANLGQNELRQRLSEDPRLQFYHCDEEGNCGDQAFKLKLAIAQGVSHLCRHDFDPRHTDEQKRKLGHPHGNFVRCYLKAGESAMTSTGEPLRSCDDFARYVSVVATVFINECGESPRVMQSMPPSSMPTSLLPATRAPRP